VATGQTLDFSGFYIWMTSNIGSAELMSLQHSNDATLEWHVLSRAQQALRPEIFARITEKLVFNRLSYEHQLEIAEKWFLSRSDSSQGTRRSARQAKDIRGAGTRDHVIEAGRERCAGHRPATRHAGFERFFSSCQQPRITVVVFRSILA
jgi:ATP-dependent Clp protease ATP-binding subunit ClpA